MCLTHSVCLMQIIPHVLYHVVQREGEKKKKDTQ